MSFSRVPYIFHWAVEHFQAFIKILGLNRAGTDIQIGMYDKQRGMDVFDKGLRRIRIQGRTYFFLSRIPPEMIGHQPPRPPFSEE